MSQEFFKGKGRAKEGELEADMDSDSELADSFESHPISLETSATSLVNSTASSSSAPNKHALSNEQKLFAYKSRRLLKYLANTRSLLEDLRTANTSKFLVHYPFLASDPQQPQRPQPSRNESDERPKLRRTRSFEIKSDDEDEEASEAMTHSVPPHAFRRSNTMGYVNHEQPQRQQQPQQENRLITSEAACSFNSQMNVLKLDIKMGHQQATASLENLENSAIAQLLDGRLQSALRHLENLCARVSDTSSKVLVTGDLNAGKSTFVNALLRRDVMPMDQQPCTTLFCEVLDADENDGIEEVHAIPDPSIYNREDDTTFTRYEMRHLEKIVTDCADQYQLLKVYCKDKRESNESLLHNGVVDIALIDSPGLNRDSLKTTALFARQEEIDVVVFVVSAENHFTLSGKEFLWNAANEKTHIFIVVNRFDSIRDKERCRRLILEQIRQLSPRTYEESEVLVHFVSAGSVNAERADDKPSHDDFSRLESCLRAFVLENRSKSKLTPAKVFLGNVLQDIGVLADFNRRMAEREYKRVKEEMDRDAPVYERILRVREHVLEEVEKRAESTALNIEKMVTSRLTTTVQSLEDVVAQKCQWQGLLKALRFAEDVRDAMADTIEKEVLTCEVDAKALTQTTLEVIDRLGKRHIDAYASEVDTAGMFRRNCPMPVDVPIELTDFFDFDLQDKLSIVSVSLGACTMVGGRILGFKDAFTNVLHASNMVGASNLRKWIVPLLSIAGISLVVYVVSDMRNAVERKVARKIRRHLDETYYIEEEARRITREGRKVLRFSSFNLQAHFQRAIEQHEKRRQEHSKVASVSQEAINYFGELLSKAEELHCCVETVDTEENLVIR
ncbi:uncharacterized protein VTP21DRAFT_701 [Calcarisporiella thermophila]|uniref:uncharacterized protein n=1 Tax=Calcarisporiella thermophila TaxID=911321 RepID=UPI0037421E0D